MWCMTRLAARHSTSSLNALRPRGTLALFGQSSGPVPPMDPSILNTKGSVFLTRPSLAHYVATPHELQWRATDVLEGIRSGTLSIRIYGTYPLVMRPQRSIGFLKAVIRPASWCLTM